MTRVSSPCRSARAEAAADPGRGSGVTPPAQMSLEAEARQDHSRSPWPVATANNLSSLSLSNCSWALWSRPFQDSGLPAARAGWLGTPWLTSPGPSPLWLWAKTCSWRGGPWASWAGRAESGQWLFQGALVVTRQGEGGPGAYGGSHWLWGCRGRSPGSGWVNLQCQSDCFCRWLDGSRRPSSWRMGPGPRRKDRGKLGGQTAEFKLHPLPTG